MALLFSYSYARHKINNRKKCTCFASHFNGHADQVVRCQAHRPVQSTTRRRRWVTIRPPYCPGGCRVHRFWRKNLSCGVVKSLFKASIKKARIGPSTQLIEETSCVGTSHDMIKAEEHHLLSSYQMLITDKNRISYQLPKKLVKKMVLMSANSSAKLLMNS